MRALWVLLLLGGAIQATPITTANPVPIDGSGWFLNAAGHDNGLNATGSGSNGQDSISFSFSTFYLQGAFPVAGSSLSVFSGALIYSGAAATIDGITGSRFDLTLGHGSGSMQIYDLQGNLLASSNLIGWVRVSSFGSGAMPGDVYGHLSLTSANPADPVSAPEPATWPAITTLLSGALVHRSWLRRKFAGPV